MKARDFLEQARIVDESGSDATHMRQHVEELLERLPWGLEITTGLSKDLLPVSQLTRLLGEHWLNRELLDEMLGALNRQMKESISDIRKTTQILGIQDINTLIRLHLLSKSKLGPAKNEVPLSLQRLQAEVEKKVIRTIYAIENVNSNHWIVHEVDLVKLIVQTGDSLKTQKMGCWPAQSALQWFLSPLCGILSLDDMLPVGSQINVDYSSCGICAVNAIEHALFSKPLWSQKSHICQRIKWFERIASQQVSLVSIS